MAERSRVSVVIPVYNGERFVLEAIRSVLEQTLLPDEVLVVDDGSTDATPRLVRELASTARVPVRLEHQTNQGPAAARNTGIRMAQGDLLAFQDADDVWLPEKLEVQVGHLLGQAACEYCVCRIRSFLEPGCAPPAGFRLDLLDQEPVAYLLGTLVARRELFDRVGLLDPGMTTAEDVDWFARVADAGAVGHVCDRVLVRKRVHSRNASLQGGDGNRSLLLALRRSVERKRLARSGPGRS